MSLGDDVLSFHRDLLLRSGLLLEASLEEQEGTLVVSMSGPDRDLMLQERAELLEAVQYLANRIFAGRLGETVRIVADCDGFRKRKEEELRQIAIRASEKVKRTRESQELGLMNPYERRIVHLAVAEQGDVTSSSRGEGYMKRVTIALAPRSG